MAALMVKAHFDGEHIQLDEPCALEKGAQLFVTVVPPELAAERGFLKVRQLDRIVFGFPLVESAGFGSDFVVAAQTELVLLFGAILAVVVDERTVVRPNLIARVGGRRPMALVGDLHIQRSRRQSDVNSEMSTWTFLRQ